MKTIRHKALLDTRHISEMDITFLLNTIMFTNQGRKLVLSQDSMIIDIVLEPGIATLL